MLDTVYLDSDRTPIVTDWPETVLEYLENSPLENLERFRVYSSELNMTLSAEHYMARGRGNRGKAD